jgi:selenide,water dikinase
VELGHLLARFERSDDPNLLVGFDTSDDAGVYRVRDDLALVQTVDLITPVCDDPYLFGQVAAANSLSDVYAMGGKPLTALNVCCFPGSGVPDGVFAEILRGGWDKTREAGAVIVGGHTVRDAELKYGLAVTGTIDPHRILRNMGARSGDALVLTKPIGTGVMIAGAKKGLVSEQRFTAAAQTMAKLNDVSSVLALEHDATACTDITGFGLAGHALEIARGSGVGIRLRCSAVPRYEEALDLIERGMTTGVTDSNRSLAGGDIRFAAGIDDRMKTLFFDPQTSGGLLISLPAARAAALVSALVAREVADAALVGEVFASSSACLEAID